MEYQKLALLAAFSGWIFGIYGYLRDSKSDSAEDAKKITEISTKLDVVILNQTETNNRQNASDRDIRSSVERIVVLEQSVKSAHHRIDETKNEVKEIKNVLNNLINLIKDKEK